MDEYQLYNGNDGQWWWRFIAANGREICRSTHGYPSRGDAVRSIDTACGSAKARRIEQKADGQWQTFTN